MLIAFEKLISVYFINKIYLRLKLSLKPLNILVGWKVREI